MLVVRGLEVLVPLLMVVAVANRETSVFIPMLIVARHWGGLLTNRRALFSALAAWAVGAVVYLGIHAYYGPRPRTEESYFGADMFLRSLSMPGQVAWFFAALNFLLVLSLLSLGTADAWLRRLFWLVVPALARHPHLGRPPGRRHHVPRAHHRHPGAAGAASGRANLQR